MKIHPKALPFLNILRSKIKHRSVKRLSPRPWQTCYKIIQPEDFNEGWYKFCSNYFRRVRQYDERVRRRDEKNKRV